MDDIPPAEVPVSTTLVQELLREQHPDLADLPIVFESEGWDNAVFRLGDELTVRLPRRRAVAEIASNELRWLPTLAPTLPLSVPTPLRKGRPGCGYPWRWSITQWFEGTTWVGSTGVDSREAAVALGGFVAALGSEAPRGAPANPYRGGPLTERDATLRERLRLLGDRIDRDAVLEHWDAALAAEPARTARWLHGDLHPANLVVDGGRLVAVIDWVDLSAGDHAYDLAAAWMCFGDARDRAMFTSATGVADEATWLRARGCALSHAVACLAGSADGSRMHRIGTATLRAVLQHR